MNSVITRIKTAFSRPASKGRKGGQTLVFMLLVLPAFIGALGLAMDVGNFYFQYYRGQEAVDAAALAGATCQADSQSCTSGGSTVATQYATTNNSLITLVPNPVAAPVYDPSYCPSPTYSTPCEVTVSATQSVPYYFARLVGVNNGTFDVSATAIGGPMNTYNPPGGTGNMMPIGLDYTTPYTDGNPISLAYKFSAGPGNWGYLALGGTGDAALTKNIEYGAQTSMSQWDGTSSPSTQPNEFVQTEPGVGRAFTDMSTYRYAPCSGQTVTSYPANSPCAVCIPLVNWSYGGGCTGKCTVPIMGFAEFFITGVTDHGSSGTVTASWTHHPCEGGSLSPGGPSAVKEGAVAIQLIK
jgi:Flp pilus assembly protein TadG